MSNEPQNFDINDTVLKLDFKVEGEFNYVDIRHFDYEMKMLELAHYTNGVAQKFFTESVILHAVTLIDKSQITLDELLNVA